MRSLLSLSVFALALSTVAAAGAQDRRRQARAKTVVVDTGPRHRTVQTVRVAHAQRYATPWHVRHYHSDRVLRDARHELFDARRDYERILRIRRRWHDATALRDPHARREAERRATRWIDAELTESYERGHRQRRSQRLHGLRRELDAPRRWNRFGAWHPNARHRKAHALDELVRMARRDVERAADHPYNRYGLSR